MTDQAWVDLQEEDVRRLLISLIGHRFGEEPELHLDEIRAERAAYAGKFMKLASVTSTDTVLDLGSGCGFGTSAIAQQAGQVIACDISPAYLSFARKECRGQENIELRKIDDRDLSGVEDASIDVVISMALFIHLNLYDIYHYFVQFERILRPGGRVAIDFADMNRLFSRIPNRGQDRLFLNHAEFYRRDPESVRGLMQWNSARGIRGVAKSAGLGFAGKRGHKLLFRK